MQAPSRGRPTLLAALAGLLAELDGPVTVVVKAGSFRAVLRSEGPESPAPKPTPKLSPLERAILDAATDEPMTVKRLAAQARRKADSHTYAAARNLCRRGLLVKDLDGYRLPPG